MDNKDIALVAAIAKSTGSGGGSSSVIDDTTTSTSTTYSSTKIEQLLSGQLNSHIVTITQSAVQTDLWNFSETVGVISQRILDGEFVILKDVTNSQSPKYYFYTGLTGNDSYQIYTDIVNDLTGSNYVEQFRISLNTSSTTTQASKMRFQILPATTSDDNGKFLGVVEGAWGKVSASSNQSNVVIFDGTLSNSILTLSNSTCGDILEALNDGKIVFLRENNYIYSLSGKVYFPTGAPLKYVFNCIATTNQGVFLRSLYNEINTVTDSSNMMIFKEQKLSIAT